MMEANAKFGASDGEMAEAAAKERKAREHAVHAAEREVRNAARKVVAVEDVSKSTERRLPVAREWLDAEWSIAVSELRVAVLRLDNAEAEARGEGGPG